ncbi:dihydroneopterin aldolase [Sphingomonas sp.]|uniref:dihydroneopterin aldolase n=1 Tax=Sphingomonas sp. TaxID=28214 RepID=UPI00286C61D2|nr:dihydroneopterin aldolase [Sphingomonas sp.]
MTDGQPRLDGLVPDHLRVRSSRILLDALEVEADIGFHDFEIGRPQRLLITVEIWLEDVSLPAADDPDQAWDYDYLRTEVRALASARRYNLQETLAHAIYHRFAALRGVKALRVATAKPDIYEDARGVGVEITSFI